MCCYYLFKPIPEMVCSNIDNFPMQAMLKGYTTNCHNINTGHIHFPQQKNQ